MLWCRFIGHRIGEQVNGQYVSTNDWKFLVYMHVFGLSSSFSLELFYLHTEYLSYVVAMGVINIKYGIVFPAFTYKLIIILKPEIKSSNKNAMRGGIVLLHY